MAGFRQDLEDQINNVIGPRMSETFCAFAVQEAINRVANEEDNKTLHDKVYLGYHEFWRTVLIGTQATLLGGVDALVEPQTTTKGKGKEVATLQTLLDELKANLPDGVADDLQNRIDAVKNKYARYRNKLIGHNDQKRTDVINQFNAEGFNFPDWSADLEQLDYVFKVLHCQHNGNSLPSEDQAKEMHFPHRDQAEKSAADTEALLKAAQHI